MPAFPPAPPRGDPAPYGPGLLVTATQLGYAAGRLLVVPLGDITARRPLFTGLLAGAGGWHAACAAAACFCGPGLVAWLAVRRAGAGPPRSR